MGELPARPPGRMPAGAECGLLSVPVDYAEPDGDVANGFVVAYVLAGQFFSHLSGGSVAGDAFHPSPCVLGDRRQAIPCEGGGPSNAGDVQDMQLCCACRQSWPGLVKWPGGAHPVDRGRRLWDMRCAMWLDTTVNPQGHFLECRLNGRTIELMVRGWQAVFSGSATAADAQSTASAARPRRQK